MGLQSMKRLGKVFQQPVWRREGSMLPKRGEGTQEREEERLLRG